MKISQIVEASRESASAIIQSPPLCKYFFEGALERALFGET